MCCSFPACFQAQAGWALFYFVVVYFGTCFELRLP
jgi:hypothetical protein